MGGDPRTIVITGASRGLGAGLAEHLHARGHALALCARSAPALPPSDRVLASRVDVRDPAAVDAFARDAADRFGALDLWINNAGVLKPIAPLRDVDPTAAREHVEINVLGVPHGSQAYVRHVRARGGPGALVNVSSGAARKPYAGWSVYCAAKAAVDRMTECIVVEEAGTGLRVWSVAPGVIDTDMQALIRATPEERFPERERFLQMKRDEAYNSPGFIADHLLALAFGDGAASEEILVRLPAESDPPT